MPGASSVETGIASITHFLAMLEPIGNILDLLIFHFDEIFTDVKHLIDSSKSFNADLYGML